MNLFKRLSVTALSAALAACANQPVDNSPTHPTSVLKANVAINGLYVPDFGGKQTVYTRSDKRRIDNKIEFDSFMMRWANSDESNIFRVDKKLFWLIDNDQEVYQECPVSGCTNIGWLEQLNKNAADEEQDEGEEYESYEDLGCSVQLASNDFDVKATGNKRVISGFDSNEYTVKWKTEFADKDGKKDTNLLQFVFWTTAPTAKMNSAWKVNRAFQEAYAKDSENDLLIRLLGKEGYMAIAAFSVEAKDIFIYIMMCYSIF